MKPPCEEDRTILTSYGAPSGLAPRKVSSPTRRKRAEEVANSRASETAAGWGRSFWDSKGGDS